MRRILKFKLDPEVTHIKVTLDSKLLGIKAQRGVPCVWVEVGDEDETTWIFRGYMTGFDYISFYGTYVDTILLENDTFVLHYYVVKND